MASPEGQHVDFDLDESEVSLFTEEVEEQLGVLDEALIALESDQDADTVQRIFRAAHTLKGSSASIGHTKMANLTHAMETLLDGVRHGQLTSGREVVDALLRAVDALRVLVDEVASRTESGLETAQIEAELARLSGQGDADPDPAADSDELSAAPAAQDASAAPETGIHVVEVRVAESCQLPGIRCFQVIQELEAMGANILETTPHRELIEEGSAESPILLRIGPEVAADEILDGISSVADATAVLVQDHRDPAEDGPPLDAGEPPGEDAATPPPAESARPGRKAQSVRIDVERLDGLMNLVGELVIDRTRLQRIHKQLSTSVADKSLADVIEHFEEATAHLTRVTDELHEEIVRSRMLPVRSVLSRLPRLVRDVATQCEKKVELHTSGEDTELDRSVIEELADPLVHIVRNAIDHGLESPDERRAAGKPETGTVTVQAWSQETYIYLSIADNGKGIDVDTLRRKVVDRGLVPADIANTASDEAVLQYIFLPGLSTAPTVSDISGRGVGMDIVRHNVEQLGGTVSVKSEAGTGTELIIQLPLTLATTKALLVASNETVYAIPLVSVTEALPEREADLSVVGGGRTLRLRDRLLPVIDLAQALGDTPPEAHEEGRYVVAARHREHQVAFLVDRLLGQQDVVVKSLGELVGNRRGLTGATILGDGTLGLIVDAAGVVAEQTQVATPA